jgi:hypothetical protein
MIRMKEGYTAAGPEGVLHAKHTYTLHRDRERQLVEAGAAEYVAATNPAPEPVRQPEVETAVAEPAAEKAVGRRARPKGR